jgi:hypothetical protein
VAIATIGGATSDSTTRRPARPARPQRGRRHPARGQLEHAIAGPERDPVEHRGGQPPPLVDLVRVLCPPVGDRDPHRVHLPTAGVDARLSLRRHLGLRPLIFIALYEY